MFVVFVYLSRGRNAAATRLRTDLHIGGQCRGEARVHHSSQSMTD